MYKEILRGIGGVGLFPSISLLLFLVVFTVAVIRVFLLEGDEALRMSRLPLEPMDGMDEFGTRTPEVVR